MTEMTKMTINDYEKYLNELNDEKLSYEFCDRIGNECGDYEDIESKFGRQGVIDYLLKHSHYQHHEE